MSEATIEVMVSELAPAVEAGVGREFLSLPEARLASREEILVRLMARHEARGGQAPGWVTAFNRERLDGALALYLYEDERVYVVEEALDAFFEESSAAETMRAPVLECVLFHELTHALQHQWAPYPEVSLERELRAATALREGQATAASVGYCQDRWPGAVADFFEASSGLAVLPSQDPEQPETLLYPYGAEVVRALELAGGDEAVWAALEDTPPTTEQLLAAGRWTALPGWSVPDLLRPAGEVMLPGEGWRLVTSPSAPINALPLLEGGQIVPESQIPAAVAGSGLFAERGDQRVVIFAYLLEEPGEATAWLERRRADTARAARGGGEAWYLGEVRAGPLGVRTRRARGLERSPGVERALRVQGLNYREYWVAREHLLVGVIGSNVRPDAGDVRGVLARLRGAADAPDPDPDFPPELRAYVDRYRAASAGEPTPSWQYRLHLATRSAEGGDYAACWDLAAETAREVDGRALERAATVAHRCAVLAGDLAGAEEMRALAGEPAMLDVAFVHDHALLLQQAGRLQEALALLEAVDRRGGDVAPPLAARLAELRLVLLVELGRWPAALELARTREVDPVTRAYAAGQLSAADPAGAVSVLVDACPLIDDPLAAGQCLQLLLNLSAL
jgi:hypothetical protein